MTCPLPLERLAEQVGEIIAAHEWASFQAEYGVSWDEWLRDHNSEAQQMLDRWWAKLPEHQQREWIMTYRSELLERIRWTQLTIQRLEEHIA